jgi:hypothetical protein
VGAARLGDRAARPRAQKIVADPTADAKLRVHAALGLAEAGDGSGVPVLGEALDHCQDVLLCRQIIIALGRLHDPRAVPILIRHLREVLNRREMVAALGEIADPSAQEALLERLREDEYVPVRIEAANALMNIGVKSRDAHLAATIDNAIREETEETVLNAARAVAAKLRGGGTQPRRR